MTIVTASPTAGYQLPEKFDLGAIPDALGVDVFRGADTDVVAVRFASREMATLREAESRRVLGLSDTRILPLADSRTQRESLLPRTAWGKAERLVAILGIALALINYWALFFAAPTVILQALPAVNIIASEVPRFTFRGINSTDAKTTVLFSSGYPATIEPAGAVLEARGETNVSVTGLNAVSSDVVIDIAAHARAGWLRRFHKSTVATQVKVWPSEKVGDPSGYRVYRSGRALEMTIPFVIGRQAPNGFRCDATILDRPGVRIVGAQPIRDIGEPQVNVEPDNELATLWWTSPPLQGFTQSSIQLFFESSVPLDENGWRNVSPEVDCRRRE